MKFQSHVLPNGLEIVAETSPHALSSAVGFFVRAGSRDETPELAGVSHFLEHMAFKGTATRTAEDVNRGFDEIGAKYNAYTTEEHTVYHAAVLPEYLPTAIDLLSGLLRPSLREDDFNVEKKVVIEEIGMYADSPVWTAYERAMRRYFSNHPLGNSVLGTVESVEGLTPERMRGYHAERYSPRNVFLAAAGKIDFPQLIDMVAARCEGWTGPDVSRARQAASNADADLVLRRAEFVQQCAFMMAAAPASDHPGRIAAEVLSNILGDETGSRFHWALVETGKVESVDFGYHEYEDQGAYMVSMSCEPALADENLCVIREILAETTEKGVTEQELREAKNKTAARAVLAAERPQNRLFSVGGNWAYRREYRTVDRDLADLEAITLADIDAVLAAYPLTHFTTICLGPRAQFTGLPKGE